MAAPEPEIRPRPTDLASFVSLVREDLENHAWQALLVASDPTYYRTEVVDGNKPEPQYLAELLGLDREGNMIQDGDTLEWADFSRIKLVTLAPAEDETPPFLVLGVATLESGETRSLELLVTTVQGRYVLTGADS
jgi:hypothetical protein